MGSRDWPPFLNHQSSFMIGHIPDHMTERRAGGGGARVCHYTLQAFIIHPPGIDLPVGVSALLPNPRSWKSPSLLIPLPPHQRANHIPDRYSLDHLRIYQTRGIPLERRKCTEPDIATTQLLHCYYYTTDTSLLLQCYYTICHRYYTDMSPLLQCFYTVTTPLLH